MKHKLLAAIAGLLLSLAGPGRQQGSPGFGRAESSGDQVGARQ